MTTLANAGQASPPEPHGRGSGRERTQSHPLLVLAIGLVIATLVGGALLVYLSSAPSTSCCPHPLDLSPKLVGGGTCGGGALTYNVSLNPSGDATTSTFGVTIRNASGALAPIRGLAPSGPGVAFSTCAPVGGGWVGVLWGPSGQLWAYYSSGATNGWTAAPGFAPPVTIADSSRIEVISSFDLASETLACVGINGNSVTGSTTL